MVKKIKHHIGIIVQARMGSTRFKGKVLKKIYNDETILDITLKNLKPLNCDIIIATSTNKLDNDIVKFAIKNNLKYYCGDEFNVLKRFIDSALEFNISKIIRICSDNIFIQPKLLSPFIEYNNSNYDYISYKIGDKNAILTHWGLFGEYVSLEALKKVLKRTKNKNHLEHITSYIYKNPNDFNIHFLDVPSELMREDIRLTIDTFEDYIICKKIIHYLNAKKLDWDYKNILNFINKNSDILDIMKKNIEKNKKA